MFKKEDCLEVVTMRIFLFIRFIFVETDKCPDLCHMNIRKEREEYRKQGKGYYHLCTDGLSGGNIFNSIAQYAFGMILMGLVCIKFNIKMYVFTLMPNHIHMIVSGTGDNCVSAFDYMKRKLSARLKRDGFSPLPEDYWFNLTPIVTKEQMKTEIIYVLRNPLEKNLNIVGGYVWSSAWLYYQGFSDLISSGAMKRPSTRELRNLIGGEEDIPKEWMFHPYLGLHPNCFIDKSLVLKLFPDAKDLQTALVKDYESHFQIASRLGELCEFNEMEQKRIVSQTLEKRFENRELNALSEEEKGKLAIILSREYGFTSYQISTRIYLKERVVRQLLNSKELR